MAERTRCGTPCLKHAHDCDRSPRHTGFHRDVQQKGDHTCEWVSPGPKDFAAVMAALSTTRAELAEWRTSYGKSTAELAMETDRARTVKAERDRLAEQVKRVRKLHFAVILGGTCITCGHAAPCPTIRALDGTEATP